MAFKTHIFTGYPKLAIKSVFRFGATLH